MIWTIAWKNIWRNRSRSSIVICAIILGTLAGVFVSGLMKGWVDQRIRSAIFTEISHLKIQNPEYLKNEEIKYSIPNINSICDFLASSPEVESFTKRTNIMCYVSGAWGNTGLKVKGINVDEEKKVSNLYKFILPEAGQYLDKDSKYPILISDKTAEVLKIKNYRITQKVVDSLKNCDIPPETLEKLSPLKDKLYRTKKAFEKDLLEVLSKKDLAYENEIFEISKTYNLRKKISLSFVGKAGNSVEYPFRICGIYKTSNTAFDQWNAFIKQDDLLKISGLQKDQYHEIAIILKDGKSLDSFQKKLKDKFINVSVLNWKELAPDAGMMADFMVVYYLVIMGIIFFALAFGIINTMLMSILERTKELGMLMAVGMEKGLVFRMIMLETIFLTLTGSVIGMVLGWGLIQYTGHVGLNFASVSEGFEAFGWAAKVYPSIELGFFFGVIGLVILVGILSSIIPAKKALKLNPSEALRVDN